MLLLQNMSHDSFICVLCLIRLCAATHNCVLRLTTVCCDSQLCALTCRRWYGQASRSITICCWLGITICCWSSHLRVMSVSSICVRDSSICVRDSFPLFPELWASQGITICCWLGSTICCCSRIYAMTHVNVCRVSCICVRDSFPLF